MSKKEGEEMLKEAKKKLDDLVTQCRKDFGNEIIMVGIEKENIKPCEAISTRCMSLDKALGVGGIPRGRIVEVYGPESSGKTTLALHVCAEAQSLGGVAAYIDVENACDPVYMRNIGLNLDTLLFSQPDTAEQALGLMEKMCASGAVDIIVLDSVAGLCSEEELKGEIGDHHVGLNARLMSQMCRKIKGLANKTNTTCLFINQLREKIGISMPGASNEVVPGGRALKFYSSVRIDVRRIGSVAEKEEKIGNQTRARIVKNKVAPPFREAHFEIIFGIGICYHSNVFDMAVKHNIIEKSGSWFSHNGQRLGLGKQVCIDLLKKNKEWFEKIYVQTKEAVFKPIEKGPLPQEATAESESEEQEISTDKEEVVEEA